MSPSVADGPPPLHMQYGRTSLASYSFSNGGMLHRQLQQQMQPLQAGPMASTSAADNSHHHAPSSSRNNGGNKSGGMGEPPATLGSGTSPGPTPQLPQHMLSLHQFPQHPPNHFTVHQYRPAASRRGNGETKLPESIGNNSSNYNRNNDNIQSSLSETMTRQLNNDNHFLNTNLNNSNHYKINNYSHKNPSQYNFESKPLPSFHAGAEAMLCRRKSDWEESKTVATAASTTTSTVTPSFLGGQSLQQMTQLERDQQNIILKKEMISLLTDDGAVDGGSDGDNHDGSSHYKTESSGNNSQSGSSTVQRDNLGPASTGASSGNSTHSQIRTAAATTSTQPTTPSTPKPRKLGRQRLRKSHSRTDLVREMALDRNYSRNTGALSSLSAVAISGGLGSGTRITTGINGAISELDFSSSTVDSSRDPTRRRSSRVNSLPATEEEAMSPLLGGLAAAPSTSSGSGEGAGAVAGRGTADLANFEGLGPLNPNHGSMNTLHTTDTVYTTGGASAITQQASGGNRMNTQSKDNYSSIRAASRSMRRSSLSGGASSNGSVQNSSMALAAAASVRKIECNKGGVAGVHRDSTGNGLAADNDSTAVSTPQLLVSSDCNRCCQMEVTLLALQADLEYMRAMELQREFVCKECENGSVHRSKHRNSVNQSQSVLNNLEPFPPPSSTQNPLYPNISSDRSVSSIVSIGSRGSRSSRLIPTRGTSNTLGAGARIHQQQPQQPTGNKNDGNFGSRTAMFLRDASKRLADLSTRHKRQVKQTTHDRAYWQNDMHLKLEKFAMMCKNLNEEAAKRSNEVKETKQLLEKMTQERNNLNSQIETLKARVALYEEESVEHAQYRDQWGKEQSRLLDVMENALKERDQVVEEISSRLDLAVETIETERRQQRMRRHIIFPSNRTTSSNNIRENGNHSISDQSGMPSSPHHRPAAASTEQAQKNELERIQKSKELAKKAQISLQTSMIQSAVRERELRKRLENMERELAEARATSKLLSGNVEGSKGVSDYLEFGLRLTRAKSTSSL
ncbi:hypothetical protein ACHAXS_012578 [Conticribra weissflogii]